MIKFIDEKGVEHLAQAEKNVTNGVNGERSISGVIISNDIAIHSIGRGWKLEHEDELYCVTYALPVDEGDDVYVEFDAVHEFFYDFEKSVVHAELNGSHTFDAYLKFIFEGSGYSYRVETNVSAFEKESFGFKNRLTLFKDIINSVGVEFVVTGKIVRILNKVGTDLSTVVKKGFNLQELRLEHNIGSFITCKKGYGAFLDKEDESKGRLEVEYLSPLAELFGKLEGEPILDERYKVEDNLLTRLKSDVDNSYSISVSLNMEDLNQAGYEQERPVAGDYIMAINDDIGFRQRVRIVSFTSSYDVDNNLIDYQIDCNSLSMSKLNTSTDDNWKKEIEAGLENAQKDINHALISADGKNLIFYGLFGENGEGEPEAVNVGDMWYKPVGEETVFYIWDGKSWVEIMSTVDNKVIQEKVSDLEQTSADNQAKTEQALLDAENARIEAKLAREEAFDSTTIAKQAERDALNALALGDSNSTDIKSVQGELSVQHTKVDRNTAQISTLKSDSERLSSTIGKVEADLENMEIGATNYLPLSSGMDEVSYKSFGYGSFQSELLPEGNGIWIKKNFVTGGTRSFFTKYIKAEEKDLPANTEITLSMEISNELPIGSNSHYFIRWFIKDGTFRDVPIIDLSTIGVSKAHRKIYATGKIPHGVDYSKNLQFTVALSRVDDEVIIRKFQMEKGNKVSDWKPSFSDLTTKNEFSTFEQTMKGFQTTVNSDITGLQSQQTQMSSQISSTVEKIDRLEIGGTNLVPLSDLKTKESTDSFIPGGLVSVNYDGAYTKIKKTSIPNGRSFLSKMIDIKPLKNSDYVTMSLKIDLVKIANSGSSIFLRVFNKGSKGPEFLDLCAKSLNTIKTSWGTLEASSPLKFSDGFEIDFNRLAQMSVALGSMDDEVNLMEWKLERGNKVTDWSPAPEDNASKSEVIQLSDQITQTVNKVETVDGKVTSQQSQITQLSTDINLKVDKDNVISQINLSPEMILLDSKLIHLSGQSLIDDAIITSAMIKDVRADKVTTGTLNAANVNIINMNANNITTGFLNANRIESRTIRAEHLRADTIELALEEMGRAVKITPMNIKIFNTNSDVEFMRLDTFGLQVARTEGNKLGIIGRNNKPGYEEIQGLTFGLEHRGQFMSWTAKYAIDDPYYTDQMILDPRGAYAGVSGLHLETRFRPKKGGTVTGGDWQWYVDSNYNKHTIAYARLANGYIAEDFYFEKGNSLQSYRNIHMNGYNITGSSSYSLKENFEYMNARDSLNAILSTDIVGYNYIENPDTFNVGFVIDDNGQSPYFTDERLIRSKKYKDDSLLVGHLMLAVKALNEKIEILEEKIEYAR